MKLSKTEVKILRKIIYYSDYNLEEVVKENSKADIEAFNSLRKKKLTGNYEL